ncbi:MAG: hypothetical protein EZS28_004816 [Streblomastix strix]|uniref:U-box domain-containing protein n=1 Tax=Streblomastix strix TaxID=222440 RepID=A0A5J4WXX0_9EUKA|nr:MAG: hypothetical protein EZS28_004816 [Streblomastix strix]
MINNYQQAPSPDVNCILPFNWSFEEYIRQCPVNTHKMQMKLFEQKLKGKVILWCALIVSDYNSQAQLKLFPFDEQPQYNGILRYTPETKPEDCKPGKQIWITARMIKMGRLLSDLELEAIPKGSPIKPDLTITYARVKEIFNPQAKDLADWMYQFWANAQFSFIAKVTMLNEMQEDENYCAQLTLEVIQPYHDNEYEPVFMFLTKADISFLPDITVHESNPLEFTARPLSRQDKHHWFTFVKINQVFNKEFKPQILPFNQIPSVAQVQQQKQTKPQSNNQGGQSKWQNVEPAGGNPMGQMQNQFGAMSVNQAMFQGMNPGMNPNMGMANVAIQQSLAQQGMNQMGGMPNVPQNQFMPQVNQAQFQQTAFQQQQQQQFQSPQNPFNQPQQSPFNPAQQSQFNQAGQMGRGVNPAPQLQPPVVAIPKMKLLTAAEEAAKHYICELSNSIMTDPVSMDGPHYYQRSELMAYIQDQGLSPVTYEATTISDIKEEPALKKELEQYLRDNPTRKNKK